MLNLHQRLMLFAGAITAPCALIAQPGSLDPSFGDNGVVQNDRWGARSIALNSAEDILVLTGSDGVLLWDSSEFPPVEFFHTVPWLQRYSDDGTLDLLFGAQGTIDLSPSFPGFSAEHVLVQTDDRILLVGHAYWPGNVLTPAIARLLPDGEPDPDFGAGGLSMFDPALADEVQVRGALLDGAGRTVVFGRRGVVHSDVALFRWLTDGSLDASFGSNGLVLLDLGGDPATGTDRVADAGILPDDGVLLTGQCHNGTAPKALFVGRLLNDGTPDPGFGNNGFAMDGQTAPPWTVATSVALLDNGSALVAGVRTVPGQVAFLRRYTANGALDMSFGLAGELTEPTGPDASAILDLLPINGGGVLWLAADTGAVVGQFTSSGAPQLAFGSAGRTSVFTQLSCQPTDFLQYNDGRVLVSGSALDSDGALHLQIYRTAGPATGWEDPRTTDPVMATVHGSPWSEGSAVVLHLRQPLLCTLDVVDVQGRVVANMINEEQLAPGEHRFELSAMRELAAGPYGLRLQMDGLVRLVHVVR
ncbi:MAG: hypothetical protein IPJ76_18530 [Flavobacteriales bacterium]|nr:MAG: hypothetical protein IPJ76_18530 [Flavobacteriales bacterium]